jgi:hypothetical protein
MLLRVLIEVAAGSVLGLLHKSAADLPRSVHAGVLREYVITATFFSMLMILPSIEDAKVHLVSPQKLRPQPGCKLRTDRIPAVARSCGAVDVGRRHCLRQ